jgi:hypothetical protein
MAQARLVETAALFAAGAGAVILSVVLVFLFVAARGVVRGPR